MAKAYPDRKKGGSERGGTSPLFILVPHSL
jgi:hypothetical protein